MLLPSFAKAATYATGFSSTKNDKRKSHRPLTKAKSKRASSLSSCWQHDIILVLVMLLAAATTQTQQAHALITIASASASNQVTANEDEGVARLRLLQPSYEYTYVGPGFCNNQEGWTYHLMTYFALTSAEECGNKCSECPGGGQAENKRMYGFQLYGGGICACQIEIGSTFDQSQNPCPGTFVTRVSGGDVERGPICGTNGQTGGGAGECWKVSSDVCPSDTSAPTGQPTPASTTIAPKAGKVTKAPKVNGLIAPTIQAQQMKSGGCFASSSFGLVGFTLIVVFIVAIFSF